MDTRVSDYPLCQEDCWLVWMLYESFVSELRRQRSEWLRIMSVACCSNVICLDIRRVLYEHKGKNLKVKCGAVSGS